MPYNLNQHDISSLASELAKLRPGRAAVSMDGVVVRRRMTSSGFDCGVGQGGRPLKRNMTPEDAAEYMLTASARHSHPSALGGGQKFDTPDEAIRSVRRGEAKPSGPSPTVLALRAVANKASLPSYKTRAQRARDALAKGEVGRAVRSLEAIVEHAGNNGRLKDVERAEAALKTVRENHDYEPGIPQLTSTKIVVKVKGKDHYVYQNGKSVTPGLTRQEAEKRRAFLSRQAARAEDAQNIDKEIAGEAIVVSRAE